MNIDGGMGITVEQAVLVGHSMGVQTCFEAYRQDPHRIDTKRTRLNMAAEEKYCARGWHTVHTSLIKGKRVRVVDFDQSIVIAAGILCGLVSTVDRH